jgi:hypothetical protein
MYRHTHAHLDEYLPSHMHTPDQRGNILADRGASRSEEHALWISEQYPQLTRTTTTTQAVHESLINDIPLCVTNGATPTLLSLHNIFSQATFKKYINDRLTKTTHGNLYRDASYNFCTEVFDLDTGDILYRASCARLIFDKLWQPWNTQKYKKLAPPLCPHCNVEDSLGHLLRDCTLPSIATLRRAAIDAARKVVSEGDDLTHAVLDSTLEVMAEEQGATLWRGLWLPAQIEAFRRKLHGKRLIAMDPRYMQHDSRISREIHAALLDISKIFGQAALNMMRERNAQTQDALHPMRKKQAGKSLPPPLELYNRRNFSRRQRSQYQLLASQQG